MKTQRWLILGVATALTVAACGVQEQAASGDGWTHLGWFSSGLEETESAELFDSVQALEASAEISIDQAEGTDLSGQLLLAVINTADGCGPAIYSDVESTETGLALVLLPPDPGQDCTDIGIDGVTVFAIDPSIIPANNGEITIDREGRPAPQRVLVEVPGS